MFLGSLLLSTQKVSKIIIRHADKTVYNGGTQFIYPLASVAQLLNSSNSVVPANLIKSPIPGNSILVLTKLQ